MAKMTVEFEHLMPEPKESDKVDWQRVYNMAVELGERVRWLEKAYGDEDGDIQHYIYEAVMEAVYGKAYWDAYNERQPWLEYDEE